MKLRIIACQLNVAVVFYRILAYVQICAWDIFGKDYLTVCFSDRLPMQSKHRNLHAIFCNVRPGYVISYETNIVMIGHFSTHLLLYCDDVDLWMIYGFMEKSELPSVCTDKILYR